MESVFPAGEREVQERAGVAAMAARLANGIHSTLPPIAQEFLRSRPMAILGYTDVDGAVRVLLLTGKPGFMRATNKHTVHVNASPLPGDPFRHVLTTGDARADLPQIGLLAIELAAHRRMRINSRAEGRPEGGFTLHVSRRSARHAAKHQQTNAHDLTANVQIRE